MWLLNSAINSSRRSTLAGAERGSRVSQGILNAFCDRVRAAKDASHDQFRVLERRHGFAEIVERREDADLRLT